MYNPLRLLVTEQRRRTLKEAVIHQVLPSILLTLVLGALCWLYLLVKPGWVTYSLSSLALVIIWLTALARLNDISACSPRWHFRRLGLVLCGASAVALLAVPLFTELDFPSWAEVYLRWGVALTWITAPNMPPWHRYVFKGVYDRRKDARDSQEPQL